LAGAHASAHCKGALAHQARTTLPRIPDSLSTEGTTMDARRFDGIARLISRRGIVALLGAGLLAGPARPARAKNTCGGRANIFTKRCKNAGGSCDTDADCAPGCACIERRQGCCYSRRKKKRGKKRGPRRCIDGAPGLYCTRIGAA
jgi:hypothetical protein